MVVVEIEGSFFEELSFRPYLQNYSGTTRTKYLAISTESASYFPCLVSLFIIILISVIVIIIIIIIIIIFFSYDNQECHYCRQYDQVCEEYDINCWQPSEVAISHWCVTDYSYIYHLAVMWSPSQTAFFYKWIKLASGCCCV